MEGEDEAAPSDDDDDDDVWEEDVDPPSVRMAAVANRRIQRTRFLVKEVGFGTTANRDDIRVGAIGILVLVC